MLHQTILALALVAGARVPQADDAEAYRLDALQTQALNRRALSEIRRPPPAPETLPPPAMPHVAASASAGVPRDEQLRRRLEEATRRWRERVAACRAGDKSSCDR